MDVGFDLDDELDLMLAPLREHDAELALHEFDYLVAQLEDWVTERPLCAPSPRPPPSPARPHPTAARELTTTGAWPRRWQPILHDGLPPRALP